MTPDTRPDPKIRELVHALVGTAPPAPPFPQADERPLASHGPRAAVVAFAVLALVAGVVGVVAIVVHHSSRSARPTGTTLVTAPVAPNARPADLAYVGAAGLIAVDASGHERVVVRGSVSDPAWSSDGKWLAFERARPVNPGNIDEDLWVVRAGGGAPRRLLANVGQWSWSPTNPLAVAAVVESTGFVNSRAEVALADGSWRWSAPVGSVTGVVWANHSGRLAIAYGTTLGVLALVDGFDPSRFCAEPCPGPVQHIDFTFFPPSESVGALGFEGTLIADRFTNDDRAVLAWMDPQGSGSAELDGLTLLSIPVKGGAATHFPVTLVRSAWVRSNPAGSSLLVVAGRGRMVTDPRQLQRCDAAGRCHGFAAGVQTMDPAWSPDGAQIAYVRSDASRDPNDFVHNGVPDWSQRYAQRRLWVASADGSHAHEIAGAGSGVAVLGWEDERHVVVVDGGRLQAVDVVTGRSTALTGPLGQAGTTLPPDAVYEPGLDGFTSWQSLVAFG